MDEDEEIGHITPMETNGVNADYIVVEEMSRTPGNVTCVTPDHSAETKQAAGNAAKDDSGSDTEVISEPRILFPAPTHKSLGLSKDVETRQTPKQTEEPTQSLAVPHVALAWANVCCSWADISPRLEESNDWFWFLVSTIYLDLVAKPDCRGDVESVLKISGMICEQNCRLSQSLRERVEERWFSQPRRSRIDGFASSGGLLDAKWPMVPVSRCVGNPRMPQGLGRFLETINARFR
ncbi:hypothetical protein JG687_00015034 [Phytophthora cactorum]|uniref:Uncharacterized protein n=1 Tax=Phytophthora cactorum TaxID=29920 RepID=A0A8T1TW18_9STRA|nr:hypothetical protein JG687_00015034 [Phytophthora cactorum]